MAQKRIHRDKDNDGGKVTFTVLESGEVLECNVGEIFPGFKDLSSVAKRLAVHAVNAKVGDSAADPKEPAYEAMKTTWDQLVAGEWSTRGEGGAGGARVTVLAEAIAQVKGLDVADVAARLAELDDDTKKGLRKNAKVAAAIATIQAAKAKAKAKAAGKEAEGAEDDFDL